MRTIRSFRDLRGAMIRTLGTLMLPLALTLGGCGGSDGDDGGGGGPAPAQIAFRQAEMVKPPKVLTGDAGDGRCASSTAPCFKDNTDFTNGQRRMLRIEDIGISALSTNSVNDFYVGGKVATVNSAVSTVSSGVLHGSVPTGTASAPVAIGARLFNDETDVLVSGLVESGQLTVAIESFGGPLPAPTGSGLPSGQAAKLMAATADFAGNGFDEVVFATNSTLPKLQIMYAANPDSSSSATFGPAITVNPMLAVAAGNFLGTGPMVVIAVAQTDGALLLQYFAVDPVSRALSLSQSLTLDRLTGASLAVNASIAVGRFNPAAFSPVGHDQMLIAVSDIARTDLLSVDADFDTGVGLPVKRLQGISDSQPGMRAVLRAGRFNWASPFDTVALLLTDSGNVGSPAQRRVFTVLTLDGNLDVGAQVADAVLGSGLCVYDMQAGNFDRRKPDTTPNAPPGSMLHDPNLQLVLLTSTATNADNEICSGGDSSDATKGMTLLFYKVNAGSNGALTVDGPLTYTWSSFTEARLRQVSLAVPDLQGRSLVLGAPTVVTIESNRQASVVLGAPPMHADFIAGKLANFSIAPDGFFATYNFTGSQSDKASSTSTTTWSFGAKESIDLKVSAGNCEVGDCASAENKTSAKQALDGSNATQTGKFSAQSVSLTQQTGLHDQIAFTDSALTVYIYPALGKTVCPAAKPGCADADKVPMTVMFAGPDSVNSFALDASGVPWYQPPWMPGNVLSYPGTLAQLQAGAFPGAPGTATLQSLTNPVTWSTSGDGSATEQASWTNGASSGSTVSLNQNYSFNNTTTVSSKWTVPGLLTGSVSASFSLSGSFGFRNLTTSTLDLTQSTGIGFTKRAQFADYNTYGYLVTPYVFGQTPPPTAVGAPPLSADLTSFGALRTGYLVDLDPGGIWKSAYTSAPDVAFNQPLRWNEALRPSSKDPGDGTCLLFGSSPEVDCVGLSVATPADPFSDEYHRMRGFFITGNEAPGQGPQLTTATAGDVLRLQARVHNFSLAPIPSGTNVRVRFYGMVWDTSTNTPIGTSFMIGTGTSQQGIPQFSTSSDNRNWLLVDTTFDTTNYANQDLVFWAVTWMEDAGGNLVAELPGKGLTRIPDASLDFAGVAALEQQYGNNVGLYHQVFHVFQPNGSSAAPAVAAATGPSVMITEVGSDAVTVARGERAQVAARVRVAHAPRQGLTLQFVDGDPAQGGRPFAMQTLYHLRPDSTHEFRVAFRSKQCGTHPLYVVAGPGTRFEHVARLAAIEVSCS